MSTIKVRFLIDRENKRVVFAEAGSDFVDLLFSFLTLPLGRIVRLFNKHSGLGSLDNLYESVEQLDAKHLQTEACKDMLLNPRSAVAELCEALKIKGIHDPNPRRLYTCSQDDCLIKSTSYYTYTSKCPCSCCGKPMDRAREWRKTISEKGEVFLIDATEFIISDDLHVTSHSFRTGLLLFKQLQIKDSSALEEKIIEFGTEGALNLLRRSLVSKNALTGVCFPDSCMQTSGDFSLSSKEEPVADEAKKEINLELVLNKNNNHVLYAEVGDDFVNQLLSFLTFPLGSALKLLSDNTSSFSGCIQNLYSSVDNMSPDCFKLKICRNILLAPMLPTFYGINNQILELEEIKPTKSIVSRSCVKCCLDNGDKFCASAPCIHGIRESEYIEQNPKSTKKVADNGGAFVVSTRRFMVADNLRISPLSLITATCNGTNLPISDLIRKEVCLDKIKVLSLLSALLISKATLTDIFSPKSMPRTRSQYNYA